MQPVNKAERCEAPYDDDGWYGSWTSPEINAEGLAWNYRTQKFDTPVVVAAYVVAQPCDMTIAFTDADGCITLKPGRAHLFSTLEEALSAVRPEHDEFVMGVFDEDKFKACEDTW